MDTMDEEKNAKVKVLKVNETLQVTCDFPVSSAFQIFWFKDYVRLYPGTDSHIDIKDNVLIIRSARETDTGQYMCTRTDLKSLSKPAVSSPQDVIGDHTVVRLPARVIEFPHEMSLMEGTDLDLECKVKGDPIPRITWFIGDGPASKNVSDDRLKLFANEDGLPDAILRLYNLTFSDRNLYKCKAQNSLGIDESAVFLTVREGIIQTNANDTYGGILLEKDKPLELQCNVTGPEAQDDGLFDIKWKKDGLNIDEGPVYKIYPNNYTLFVENPKEGEQTGNYTCTLSRGDHSFNATIYVQARAHVQPFSRSLNLVQGDPLLLKCYFGGVPIPLIRWYKDDILVNETDSRVNISQKFDETLNKLYSLLRIEDLDFDDRGEYKCEVKNGLNEEGPLSSSITIRVKDRLAALWPFLGICVEVIILCTIIFIYEKKRSKAEYDDADIDHNTENKHVHDKEGMQDVRHRK